jgi:hypothetical protein
LFPEEKSDLTCKNGFQATTLKQKFAEQASIFEKKGKRFLNLAK